MAKPLKPTNLFTSNNWYFEIPGLVSPQFHKLSGISKSTGEVSIVDGGTNIKHKFASTLKEFSDITLVRALDGSIDDTTMRVLADRCMDSCFRFDGHLVKLHCGKEVFRIAFMGMRIKRVSHPDLSTESEERYDMQYLCSVSEWAEIPTA